MSKLRVLHCIATLERGGAEQQLRLLLRRSDPGNVDFSVLCLDDSGTDELPPHVAVHLVDRGRKWDLLGLSVRIWRVIEEVQPNLLHLWLPEIVTLPAAVAGRALGIPVLTAQRRTLAPPSAGALWLRDRASYLSHALSAGIVANFHPNVTTARVFKWLFRRKRGWVIRNAVDVDGILHWERPPSDGGRPFLIVYAGRLARQKRVDRLLDSVSRLKSQGLQLHLHVFGTGSVAQERDLARNAERHCPGVVTFHGFRPDWLDFAKSADLLVLPSVSEGMPNVLLEACAVGLPVLATDIPEIRDVFTHGTDAWLVGPDRDTALADGIRRLYEDVGLRQHLINGGARLIDRFAPHRMVDQYMELYRHIVSVQ